MKILVIGAGSFGTALATTLADGHDNVTLWVPRKADNERFYQMRINDRYLPNIKLSENLVLVDNLKFVSNTSDIIFLCLPAQKTRSFLKKNITLFPVKSTFVLCGKGIDSKTLELQSNILLSVLPNHDYAVLSGPGFAEEIAKSLPTALVVAHPKIEAAKRLQKKLATKSLRLYSSSDPIGVQLGGALKNVVAIGCGIATALNLGESARISLMMRGFSEISHFAVKIGARKSTLFGLSGFGDLCLTCNSNKSRNFQLGKDIFKTRPSLNGITSSSTIEGIKTTDAVLQIAQRINLEMPIAEAISKTLKGEIQPMDATELLLSRPLRIE